MAQKILQKQTPKLTRQQVEPLVCVNCQNTEQQQWHDEKCEKFWINNSPTLEDDDKSRNHRLSNNVRNDNQPDRHNTKPDTQESPTNPRGENAK